MSFSFSFHGCSWKHCCQKAESNESNLFIQKLECSDGIQLII